MLSYQLFRGWRQNISRKSGLPLSNRLPDVCPPPVPPKFPMKPIALGSHQKRTRRLNKGYIEATTIQSKVGGWVGVKIKREKGDRGEEKERELSPSPAVEPGPQTLPQKPLPGLTSTHPQQALSRNPALLINKIPSHQAKRRVHALHTMDLGSIPGIL